MKRSVNLIRNAGFVRGPEGLAGWTPLLRGRGATVRQARRGDDDAAARHLHGVLIRAANARLTAGVEQVVKCKPGEFYHLDADVTCDLTGGEGGGLSLAVQPMDDRGRPLDEGRVTPVITRASRTTTIRAYYQTPARTRLLRVAVRIDGATGWARVGRVRCLSTLDPEECSHPLAIPPPPHTLHPTRVAARVAVLSDTAATRPVTPLLRAWFGDQAVSCGSAREWRRLAERADAILLPDADPPKGLGSAAAVMKLARDRIVIMSVPAWSRIAGDAFKHRRIAQEDDPIAAKIAFGDAWTPGFALDDTITFAWSEGPLDTYVQRQFRPSPAFRDACKKLGLVTRLTSMCQQDATSFQPVALSADTPSGALFVMDIEPCESSGSTMGEPSLAAQLLLGFLGHARSGLGQYAVPALKESDFRGDIREAANRFAGWVVHDDDVPTREVREQLVTIGGEDRDFGLPLRPKPVILIRSGLQAGDVESVYSAMLWFKQLVRTPPHGCPYAQALTSAFRLAWATCATPWDLRCGWRRAELSAAPEIDADEGLLVAVIDLVSRPAQRARVVTADRGAALSRLERWLPSLWSSFSPHAYFGKDAPPGGGFADHDQHAWRKHRIDVEVAADPGAFDADLRRSAARAGGELLRVEIPGHDADFAAHSITRTDVGATLLEHVVGLQFGLIAVNRSRHVVHFDGFEPMRPGDALAMHRDDPVLRLSAPRVG